MNARVAWPRDRAKEDDVKTRQLLAVGLFRVVVLYGMAGLAQSSRRDGQTAVDPNLIVMCGDCAGGLFSLTAERGMLLMKTDGDTRGDLWFYPFTPGTSPIKVGHLPEVGKRIDWGKRTP